MRVLQVCPRYPPQTGGVETHVQEISERLVDLGHEVVVHTADAGREGERRERWEGVRIRRHRALAPGGAFHIAPGITGGVRRTRADVVHAHNYHSLPMLFAALGIGDERFVVTPHYHGASAHRLRDGLLRAYEPVGTRTLRGADAVVAVSEWERAKLWGDFGVEATVVPNGVDVQRFSAAVPEERDEPYLLSVGRLERYKGVQHIIKALSDLPDYDLLVAGDGPVREELRRLAESQDIAERVEFLGVVSEDRLARLYAGAAAYLNLSKFEAYGLTVGEALAAGTPCVVYDRDSLGDWTRYKGVVGVDTTVPTRVAEAVTAAVGTPVSGTLPNWDDTVDRLLDVYEPR